MTTVNQWDHNMTTVNRWDPTITTVNQWDPTITTVNQWDHTMITTNSIDYIRTTLGLQRMAMDHIYAHNLIHEYKKHTWTQILFVGLLQTPRSYS
jgi:hypothetical protein